jgi:transposase
MRNLVSLLWSEWKDLEQQIVAMNEEVEQIASSDPACQRLRQIPGIGPLVATANRRGKDAFGLEAQNRAPTLPHHGDDYLEFPPRSALDS